MKRSLLLLAGAGLLPAIGTPLPAQARQPISFDQFLAMQISGDPRISPDGSMVAFTLSVPSQQENRNISRIWVVPVSGGAPRALSAGPGTDLAPRWAPDGKSVAFISTRGGSPQVWQIVLAGGDATQLSNIESGVNDFLWAPDGRAVYLTSDVKWPPSQEIDRRNGALPTQAKIWTDLFYRHWNEWRVGLRTHLFRVELATKSAKDLTPFDRDVPTLALGGTDVAVARSGADLAIVYNPDQNIAESTNNDVWVIRGDGGTPDQVTTRQGNDHSPAFSPDGSRIAYLSMETPGFEADRQQVMLYDRATRQHRPLTGDLDRSVSSLAWTPDGRTLLLEIEERGTHNFYALDVATGRRNRIVSGGVNSGIQVSPRGDRIVFVRQSATMPPEIFTAALDGSGLRSLAPLNSTALAGLDLAPLESFSFGGALGDSVHAWLLKPPGFDPSRKYPVTYLVHGGPQSAWLDSWGARWNYHLFASRGHVTAMVNFHGSTGYGQQFTNSISKHWGDYPFEDLMKGLDVVARLPYVDSTRMGAAGASYGGYMIFWMAGQTNRFKTLVAHDGVFNGSSMVGSTEELWFTNREFGEGGMTNPETRAMLERWSPVNHTDKWKTPMLVVHGQQDMRVDVSEGLQAFTALKVKNLPAKFLYFPDEGHWVLKPRNRRIWWETVLDWLDLYLQPKSMPNTP